MYHALYYSTLYHNKQKMNLQFGDKTIEGVEVSGTTRVVVSAELSTTEIRITLVQKDCQLNQCVLEAKVFN